MKTWPRIRVKWDGRSTPPSVVVSEGDSRYVIQLGWEVQPRMMSERVVKEPERGEIHRGEGVSTRVGENVKAFENCCLKETEGTEGVKSGRERKSSSLELSQIGGVEPVLGLGSAFGLGPTCEDQGLRQAQGRK